MERRKFVGVAAAAASAAPAIRANTDRPAILGGEPVRRKTFPDWPVSGKEEEQALLGVLRSGKWGRIGGSMVSRFEQDYAKLTTARHCLATANGTSALIASLGALGIDAGDEVIVPPYTFVATVNAVLLFHAVPVFADIDPATFQVDAKKIDAVVTSRTKAIIPVHIGGGVGDLDAMIAVGRKHNIPVIEDACQAHMAEWKGKHVGTYGATGCFSFQASKNLNAGEGGAMLTNDDNLVERAYAFHSNGRGRRIGIANFSYESTGANLRLTEFQAAILLSQMTRLRNQTEQRENNAAYLTKMLSELSGVTPAKVGAGCTRNAYHLYMFRYDAREFAGLDRTKFLKALSAEGIPGSSGYAPLNKEPFIETMLNGRGFQRILSKQQLAEWRQRNHCPENDRLCREAVWFTQTMLLGPKEDMDHIAAAIQKIKRHAAELKKA